MAGLLPGHLVEMTEPRTDAIVPRCVGCWRRGQLATVGTPSAPTRPVATVGLGSVEDRFGQPCVAANPTMRA